MAPQVATIPTPGQWATRYPRVRRSGPGARGRPWTRGAWPRLWPVRGGRCPAVPVGPAFDGVLARGAQGQDHGEGLSGDEGRRYGQKR